MDKRIIDIKTVAPAPRTRKHRWLTWLALCLLLAGATALYVWGRITTPYDGKTAVRLYVRTADRDSIKSALVQNLGSDFGGQVFRLWDMRGGQPDRAVGSYVIEPGDKAYSVASRLKQGRQTPVRVTFNNIRLFDDLATRVSSKMQFSAGDFMRAAANVLPQRGYARPEVYAAAFLPDTYEFYWTDPAEKTIERFVDETDRFWTAQRVEKARALNLDRIGVATVASIVEEETNSTAERPMVARLYLNRLDKGMKLQADPTVRFAAGDFALRRLAGPVLKTQSPYNTYLVAGLPPGPIRIAERATIDAVLDAPSHDYLYMCAKADFSGRHAFAADYGTHMRNARAYQSELDRRGIRN